MTLDTQDEGSGRVRVVSLGSGSSGNALLIQTGRTAVLVDAGFGPRMLASRLRAVGVTPGMLSAILLTHEHADHARGAAQLATQHGIPLVADPRTLAAVFEQAAAYTGKTYTCERVELPIGRETRLHDIQVRSFAVSHDAVAPCGYLLATSAWSVCFATDTGEAGAAMVEAMRAAHLLVIEANHDVDRLVKGPYPWPLKKRILSPTGHLSNEQTCRALEGVLDDGARWVWLAHLSRTNNTPDLARAHVRDFLRERGLAHVRITVAPPDIGPVWDSATLLGTHAQPALFAPPQPPLADADVDAAVPVMPSGELA